MGFKLEKAEADKVFLELSKKYDIYAPKLFVGNGCFSDTDVVRYGRVTSSDEIEFDKKSEYSFKEVLLPINSVLFYFTEEQITVPKPPPKERLVFLKSCDLYSVEKLDQIYLKNGYEDFYYNRIRENTKFILMGCESSCETGFCVSMGTNKNDNYSCYLKISKGQVLVDCKDVSFEEYFKGYTETEVKPDYVSENKEKVVLPKQLSLSSFQEDIWKEYGDRCISCGRCNFVCPTCTCFTTQDIYYKENENVGERRRVWASCQVDGYTEIAGGHEFRKAKGDRFRFKVMHKIYDYEKRFGSPMCTGCGRCDDICPEYISYISCINRLSEKEAK